MPSPFNASRAKTLWSATQYLFTRLITVLITIFLGVFVTVLVANQPPPPGFSIPRPQFEAHLENQIERYLRSYAYEKNRSYTQDPDGEIAALRADLRRENGLEMDFWPRNALWTFKALTFDWGRLATPTTNNMPVYGQSRTNINPIPVVLAAFPNTLLLVGIANLLIFLIGLPLSLYLARHYGGFLDRLLAFFAPFSSIPSWVIAILLVSLFAVELRWLPIGGMFDKLPPETPLGYVEVVARHMVLPVLAIVTSMLFQLVYAWRTFFVIYSQEDYVELARAKGLKDNLIEQRYILQPTLPYVITSFTLSLVGFWQMTMALEVVFQWPGIGLLYIKRALPNFWGESYYAGELLIAVSIVVIFAYLLGAVVFLLDIVYALVDPRIHLQKSTSSALNIVRKGEWMFWKKQKADSSSPAWTTPLIPPSRPTPGHSIASIIPALHRASNALGHFGRELRRYPSAIVGLAIILLMLIGSIYAVTAYPYAKIGTLWSTERLSGQPSIPRLAEPAWTNAFRAQPHLATLRLDETAATRNETALENGWRDLRITYELDYPYGDIPQEIYLYITPHYAQKLPYLSAKWTTPDGRVITLKGETIGSRSAYNFEKAVPAKRMVTLDPEWQQWYTMGQINPLPAFYALFAIPGQPEMRIQNGRYRLEINALLFEPGDTLQTEFTLLGSVYGLAGTDFLRRDLLVPLLWGMPFALVFGLVGASLTTILAMLFAATGVWFGGWVDTFIQRLTEANMVLPILAIGVLVYAIFGVNLWVILAVIILLNVFGSPTKTFRSAFLQVREAPYIEAARAYGVSNARMITHYLIPRIMPVLVPQLVTLIPSFVFLEATLGLFNIKSIYPTWGRIIYEGLSLGALYGSRFWVLEPIALLLLTSLAFAMLGIALERILNPRLLEK